MMVSAASIASSSLRRCLLLCFLLGAQIIGISAASFGINYGQIANDLPSPSRVTALLQSIGVSRVKLYDADQTVLTAFAGSGIDFIIGIPNDQLANMTDPAQAQSWVRENLQPHLPQTRIACVNVGNEVYSGEDTAMISNLLPAMKSLHQALVTLGLDDQVNVSTAHSLAILGNSYPPSMGTFRQDLAQYIQPLLDFHSSVNSPFLINAYPFFAYKADPGSVSLPYVLFEPNYGVVDQNTNLTYDNMLYAQIDSVYAAMKAMGFTDIPVRISETGWPSKGDSDEVGASVANAMSYNGNLMQRLAMNQGTPLKPSVPVDVYVFALFNEDLKPGPASERNYGMFYPDGTPVYKVGFQGNGSGNGNLPSLIYSSASSNLMVTSGLGFLTILVAALIQLQR